MFYTFFNLIVFGNMVSARSCWLGNLKYWFGWFVLSFIWYIAN